MCYGDELQKWIIDYIESHDSVSAKDLVEGPVAQRAKLPAVVVFQALYSLKYRPENADIKELLGNLMLSLPVDGLPLP